MSRRSGMDWVRKEKLLWANAFEFEDLVSLSPPLLIRIPGAMSYPMVWTTDPRGALSLPLRGRWAVEQRRLQRSSRQVSGESGFLPPMAFPLRARAHLQLCEREDPFQPDWKYRQCGDRQLGPAAAPSFFTPSVDFVTEPQTYPVTCPVASVLH